ncbi:hypothetical protein BS78_K331600 [Paspalum vaginatum]|uniref:Uncharacterized protein n=1 Tax=Paspalum vaginatum TaxID=158149 RepID=A0A9W7X7I6_9POAL|nr:hypothetical protein BS78_K331600 [Paspalum vaginatum]
MCAHSRKLHAQVKGTIHNPAGACYYVTIHKLGRRPPARPWPWLPVLPPPPAAIALSSSSRPSRCCCWSRRPPAPLSSSGSYEDDRVHDFLRVLDRAAAYRRECFGECAKGCYCADNPYSCLRECMPTPPTRRCGATYDVVQGVFSSSATFASSSSSSRPETADAAGDMGDMRES